jgi:hypothetical protein
LQASLQAVWHHESRVGLTSLVTSPEVAVAVVPAILALKDVGVIFTAMEAVSGAVGEHPIDVIETLSL